LKCDRLLVKMKDKTSIEFLEKTSQSIDNKEFVKITLSKPKHNGDLKNIYARLVLIKNQEKISFTFRYQTRDEVKNMDIAEAINFIDTQISTTFLNAVLFSTHSETTLSFNKKGENPQISSKKMKNTEGGVMTEHNYEKHRLISPKSIYLNDLGITTQEGIVKNDAQHKYRQINKYVEIIESLIKENPLPKDAIIADFGSGKGYLTFALYDYLTATLKATPSVFGFELRENLVTLCNDIAHKNEFSNLKFITQDINDFEETHLDMLIALHACDIATDIAIAKGIKAQAKIIVVAPCCHKQIRKQLAVKNEMQPILRHGIMEERQAEILTDGIRALLLEAHGYKTKVFEFISTEHTPKNVMIVGIKNHAKKEAFAQIERIKTHYGIAYHHLETLLENYSA
jgi:SAM-dependent methyltransferase